MLAALGVWEALVRSRRLDYEYLPAPSETADAGWSLLMSGELGTNVLHTRTGGTTAPARVLTAAHRHETTTAAPQMTTSETRR